MAIDGRLVITVYDDRIAFFLSLPQEQDSAAVELFAEEGSDLLRDVFPKFMTNIIRKLVLLGVGKLEMSFGVKLCDPSSAQRLLVGLSKLPQLEQFKEWEQILRQKISKTLN